MFKAKLYQKLTRKKVQCLACQRYCQIEEGKSGFCLARKNLKGELYSLNYGLVSALQVDPIEKKPLYHFYPGSQVLSVGGWGCNFRCRQCLNWHCSWGKEAIKKLESNKNQSYISPENLVSLTLKQGYPGIAFTYNEPTIWSEYVYDTAFLAKEKGLYTVFVSNGSWSKETLVLIGTVIDAANIDFKGWGEKIYQLQGAFWGKDFLSNLILAKEKYQIHLEFTTLIIPTINDDLSELKKIAKWLVKNLGPKIPWHLSRFSPSLAADEKFQKIPPTPKSTLMKAYEIGKEAGLKFVYVWATQEGEENFFSLGETFCPNCQQLVIKREGWLPQLVGVRQVKGEGFCSFCGEELYLKLKIANKK